jgi:hypothetical protein
MFKRLLAVLTAMLLTLATFAFAAELSPDHPDTYTVKKGDTLWDISARFLKKPWLWPEIWQANPQVKNPHLIYPGDVLSLAYLNGEPRVVEEQGPQIKEGEPITAIPLADIEPYLKQLTIVQDPKTLPYVVGLEEGHLLTSAGQVAYVRGLVNPQPGDQIQIARAVNVFAVSKKTKDGRYQGGVSPIDFRGDTFHRHWGYLENPHEAYGTKLGYEMMAHCVAEVTRVQGDLAIVLLKDEGREVRIGDRVLPVEEHPYDPYFYPQAPTSIPSGATVMAVPDGLEFSGTHQVVALSVGSADGVRNGTTFSVWHPGENAGDMVAHRNNIAIASNKTQMPDDYLGHVMVFRTFDKVSYGLMMDGIRPVAVGDMLKDPDAVE